MDDMVALGSPVQPGESGESGDGLYQQCDPQCGPKAIRGPAWQLVAADVAFSAFKLWPGRVCDWLVRHRRCLGIS